MEELINLQELDNDNLTHYLEVFNNLTDEEIVNFFNNKKGNSEIKSKLIEIAENRINKLPTPIFIEVSTWAMNPKSYLNNYLERIEKMTYEEFVEFLYNGVYSEKVMLSLTESSIYKKYLEEEKTKELGISMQIIALKKELFLVNNNVTKLDTIGTEIIKLVNKSKEHEEMYSLVCFYLDEILKNMDSIPISSVSLESAFKILKNQMRKHEVLTPKMIEFYINYRIKESNLPSIYQNVMVTLEEGENTAAYEGYEWRNGTLHFHYKNLLNEYKKFKGNLSKEVINDLTNIRVSQIISHELKHVLDHQEDANFHKNISDKDFQGLIENKLIVIHNKEFFLRKKIGEYGYQQNHNSFISEARADIFSFFESNKELQTRFNDCFDERTKAAIQMIYAQTLVKYYTDKNGQIKSPMEKFNEFYLENIGEDAIPIVPTEDTDIMNSLMNGDKIPEDVYKLLQRIAKGEIRTTNLYVTLNTYIQNKTNSISNEETLETQGPTL